MSKTLRGSLSSREVFVYGDVDVNITNVDFMKQI